MKRYEIEYATTSSLSGYVDVKTEEVEAESELDAISMIKEKYVPLADVDIYSVREI